MPTLPSACPLDCPDSCSLEVRVEGDRIASIGGSRDNALTAGFICAKVRRFGERVHGPERVLHPALRSGPRGSGQFRDVSWEEALDRVAGQMREARDRFGGEAILPYSYGGSNGYLTQDTTDARLWRRLGASRLKRAICAAPSGAAAAGLYGKMPGVALTDYAEARLIVLWGVNPSVSGIHLVPRIYEAKRRGALLAVVDPRRTPLAEQADLNLPVRPGADLPVALAIHRWLFESGRADTAFLEANATGVAEFRRRAAPWTFEAAAEAAGIPAERIEALARLYADSSPAVIRCGWGLERNRHGGSAVAAVLALPAVAGKFGARGGGYTMSNSPAWTFEDGPLSRAQETPTRCVNMNELGKALTELDDPPVRVLFVYNSNAAVTAPNQRRVLAGLSREDLFTVVFDSVWTDTARLADAVLPATTFFEHREISRGYGAFVLHDAGPVISRVGQARPNYEVFADLTGRIGLSLPGDPESPDALARALLEQSPRADAIRRELEEARVALPDIGDHPVQFHDVFPRTGDRRIHLVPEELDREAPSGLYAFAPPAADFPLALVSPASERAISSTLYELSEETARLEIHPEDARSRGIEDGAGVRVFNALGEVLCQARVTDSVRPGVVGLPKGLWRRHTENGFTATALCPDTLTDIGGGACFNDARVEVESQRRSAGAP